jgi:nicotinate-nucleotide adenylyltransferase
MRRVFPDARLFWLMGSDQWADLPNWNRPNHLASLVEFIVVTRGNAPVPQSPWTCRALGAVHPASATAIRADPAAHASWLHPAVAAYIAHHHLYPS